MRDKLSRRRLFGLAAGMTGSTLVARHAAAMVPMGHRTLGFHNLHTGETFAGAYWADGAYQPDALVAIRKVLRDFRTNDEHEIDRRLLDLLSSLKARLDTAEPFQVISGYRSPKTNAMLVETSSGVASHSFHMRGMAIDIRVPGHPLSHLREAALELGQGGVGYYPASDFVHVDVGPVRRW